MITQAPSYSDLSSAAQDQVDRILRGRPLSGKVLPEVNQYIDANPDVKAVVTGAAPTGLSPQNLEAYKQQAIATAGSSPSRQMNEQFQAQNLIAKKIQLQPPQSYVNQSTVGPNGQPVVPQIVIPPQQNVQPSQAYAPGTGEVQPYKPTPYQRIVEAPGRYFEATTGKKATDFAAEVFNTLTGSNLDTHPTVKGPGRSTPIQYANAVIQAPGKYAKAVADTSIFFADKIPGVDTKKSIEYYPKVRIEPSKTGKAYSAPEMQAVNFTAPRTTTLGEEINSAVDMGSLFVPAIALSRTPEFISSGYQAATNPELSWQERVSGAGQILLAGTGASSEGVPNEIKMFEKSPVARGESFQSVLAPDTQVTPRFGVKSKEAQIDSMGFKSKPQLISKGAEISTEYYPTGTQTGIIKEIRMDQFGNEKTYSGEATKTVFGDYIETMNYDNGIKKVTIKPGDEKNAQIEYFQNNKKIYSILKNPVELSPIKLKQQLKPEQTNVNLDLNNAGYSKSRTKVGGEVKYLTTAPNGDIVFSDKPLNLEARRIEAKFKDVISKGSNPETGIYVTQKQSSGYLDISQATPQKGKLSLKVNGQGIDLAKKSGVEIVIGQPEIKAEGSRFFKKGKVTAGARIVKSSLKRTTESFSGVETSSVFINPKYYKRLSPELEARLLIIKESPKLTKLKSAIENLRGIIKGQEVVSLTQPRPKAIKFIETVQGERTAAQILRLDQIQKARIEKLVIEQAKMPSAYDFENVKNQQESTLSLLLAHDAEQNLRTPPGVKALGLTMGSRVNSIVNVNSKNVFNNLDKQNSLALNNLFEITKQKNLLSNINVVRIRQRLNQQPLNEQINLLENKQINQVNQVQQVNQQQSQKPQQRQSVRVETRVPSFPRTPENPMSSSSSIPKGTGLGEGLGDNEGYYGEVKDKGKWLRVTKKPLTQDQARAVAAKVVDETTAVSLRLIVAKQKAQQLSQQFTTPMQKFRDYSFRGKKKTTLPNFGLIENKEFRIDTLTEKQQLSASKYLKNKGFFGTFRKRRR